MLFFFRVIYLSVSFKTGTGQTSRFSSTKLAFVTVCGKKERKSVHVITNERNSNKKNQLIEGGHWGVLNTAIPQHRKKKKNSLNTAILQHRVEKRCYTETTTLNVKV